MKSILHYALMWLSRFLSGIMIMMILIASVWFVFQKFNFDIRFVEHFLPLFDPHFPFWVPLVASLIDLFISLSFGILLIILFYTVRENWVDKIKQKYLQKIVPLFFQFIYKEHQYSIEERFNEIKNKRILIKDELSKQLFLKMLSQVHAQTTGLVKNRTYDLFRVMKWERWLYWNLHSPVKWRQLFAMSMIAEFHLVAYSKDVRSMLKKKDYIIRSMALETLLKLHLNETLLLLTGLDFALDAWTLNMIVKIARESEEQELEYSLLMRHPNPEISALGIVLARLNHRTELKSIIFEKMDVDQQQVKDEAVLTWIVFAESRSDYLWLLQHFEEVSEKVQKRIVRSMRSCPDQTLAVDFLSQMIEQKPVSLKTVAMLALLDLDINMLQKYQDSDDLLIRQSYMQVMSIF
ncbi:MAG: hypothetical protein ACP5F6_05305 [Microbacter sp.]